MLKRVEKTFWSYPSIPSRLSQPATGSTSLSARSCGNRVCTDAWTPQKLKIFLHADPAPLEFWKVGFLLAKIRLSLEPSE